MLRFLLHSYLFKVITLLTVAYAILIIAANNIVDRFWGGGSPIPLVNIENVYKPPTGYDNFSRINIKLKDDRNIVIEANKRFKIPGSGKEYDFYDTVLISTPDTSFSFLNKIYFNFEDNKGLDSVYFVVSESGEKGIYWRQVFYSSVIVGKLNEFSKNPAVFRINKANLVNDTLLDDNDSLINLTFRYFNENINNLSLGDCGINCETYKSVTEKFNVPCRIIGLQGGDYNEAGYLDRIGYPLHAICEIYSSKQKKWYIVDPTYGVRFRRKNSDIFLNAVEINNYYIFKREHVLDADSILFKKQEPTKRDYFKFYENVFYLTHHEPVKIMSGVLNFFFKKYNFKYYIYSSNLTAFNNSYYYLAIKLLVFAVITLLLANIFLFFLLKRLAEVKRKRKEPKKI